MKKYILKGLLLTLLLPGVFGCGDNFLRTTYYAGPDLDGGLTNVRYVEIALNGCYSRLFKSQFAGNSVISIGDIPTDLTYWNTLSGAWESIYGYTYDDTEGSFGSIWDYGYKTADNSARVIKASKELYEASTASEKKRLELAMAEAYALRGYAQLMLVNVFAHQVKVNGTDFSSQLGIVVIDQPKKALSMVSRSTIGESYEAVLSDFENSLKHFEAAGGDRKKLQYMNVAAVHGFMARTYLYLERWDEAASKAAKALEKAAITTLTYGNDKYKALYDNSTSNKESFFALGIGPSQHLWSGSCGTLWSAYNMSPSPKLLGMYGPGDCRKSVMAMGKNSTPMLPIYAAGKFGHFDTGNPNHGTNYLVNAPEMFLIIAEAKFRSPSKDEAGARNALLTVAKRNADITTEADLGGDFMAFLKDERARELFQEGFRLWDLRRWDEKAEVGAIDSPAIKFTFTNYQISDLVFPIPEAEITANFGTEQNKGWSSTRPRKM